MPIQTEFPSNPYDGPTLYEFILVDVLYITMRDISSKERITDNLGSLATRALFNSTNELSNAELLRILRPETANSVVGKDTREARNLRSLGNERTLKFGTIRSHCISFLATPSVTKADIVRSWTYAAIHEAARRVVANVRATDQSFREGAIRTSSFKANEMLNACFQLVPTLLEEDYEKATVDAALGRPSTEERRYLHLASTFVIEAMDRPVNPASAWTHLLNKTYPALEDYVFEPK